jgi:AraC-like DNA-binding protein
MIPNTVFPVHQLVTPPGSSFSMHKYLPGDRVQRVDYPHRHDFHQVIHITEGRGHHVIDHYSFPITPPLLFFVAVGQIHYWQVVEHLQGDGLLFRPDFLEPSPAYSADFDKLALFYRLTYAPLKLDRHQSGLLQRLIELITHEHHTHNSDTVLNAYLHILFTEIQRLCVAAQPVITLDPTTELVRRYRQLVYQYFMEHRSVQFYADQLGVSVGHLSRSIKDATGHSASQIIRQEMIMEAKRLLVNTDLAVERISDQLAFNDPAYFGRFFKRETGFSPGSYRDVILEKNQIKHR